MKYIDAVYNFFNFSSRLEINKKNLHKESIQISGKLTKNIVIFYLIFCFIIIIVNLFTMISSSVFLNKNHSFIIYILLIIFAFLLVIVKHKIIFKKYEYKPKNINIYQRELPSNLTPAHVRMIINDGLIDENTLAATLLDLLDKGYLFLNYEEKEKIFKKNMVLTKTNKDTSNLFKYEKFLLDWFINICGDGQTVTSNQIHEVLTNQNNKKVASEMFEQFQALIIISFPIQKFYKKTNFIKKKIFYTVMMILGFFPLFSLISPFLFIYGFGCLLFSTPLYVLNQIGANEKDSWLDLKKFLLEFSNIKDKTVEMIKIWNYYLTYSVVLNIDTFALNEIKTFFGDNIFYGNKKKIIKKNDLTNYKKRLEKKKKQFIKYKDIIKKDIYEESKKYMIRNIN